MHSCSLFYQLAGLSAVAAGVISPNYYGEEPSGHDVSITGVAFAGSGCPAGSVAGQLSGDLTTLTVLYDSFVSQAGPGVKVSDYRKNCQLNVKLKYPQGWQFSVFKADYRGYAQIPQGDTGTCKATYYFSGDSKQTSTTMTIKGPYDDNYIKTDQLNVETTVWSPCGLEGLLNINSEVRLSPQDTSQKALLTVRWSIGNIKFCFANTTQVDSTDLKFTQVHYLQWQKC